MIKKFFLLLAAGLTLTSQAQTQYSGLLFHLSGNDGYDADYAVGEKTPNYMNKQVELLPNGMNGTYLHCKDRQVLSYWAPQNIYAQRGTLSFFWRASRPLTETEFPIFRVGYADHSSWDMVFLRIDYNGHGFDAFVTDANLARVRVSASIAGRPKPEEWLHMALAWDENKGIRFYINGKKVGQKDSITVLDAALDQFGPHSRIISPYQVQSEYNFVRGGDIDEIRIYDQMLNDDAILLLSRNRTPDVPVYCRNMKEELAAEGEWQRRYGFDAGLPPYLIDELTSVRKVQISEAYDHKRWWWKANDGIKETTWPGVYNRSRIAGRNDYFQLPDWDCYSVSGKEVRFNMPQEPWNHIEIYGGARGKIGVTENSDGKDPTILFTRKKQTQRSVHRLDNPVVGETIVFRNDVQETPIGEFDTYYVEGCQEDPEGIATLTYQLTGKMKTHNPNLDNIRKYIDGRYPKDERSMLMAVPRGQIPAESQTATAFHSMPIAHLLIPSDYRSVESNPYESSWGLRTSYTWINMHAGLDGILITIPPLNVKAVEKGCYPLNISVKDPIWPLRSMLDFSFSVKPNEQRRLWLDLRDRILPDNAPLYITLAGGNSDFQADMLEGAEIQLVFKDYGEARQEHVADRFSQVRDNYAMIIEERPNHRKLQKYDQFEKDLTDLLRVDPTHKQARNYWYVNNQEQIHPEFELPQDQPNVPRWASLQMAYLKLFRQFAEWQIDHRQIENGEFGGGISDDSDFCNYLPPLAMMGCIPDKIDSSLKRIMQSCLDQGMLIKGMSAIQMDALHTYEEGVNLINQLNLMHIGNPTEVNRLLEATKSVNDHLVGVNKAGHMHFRSNYFSATKLAESGVWGWSSPDHGNHLNAAILLADLYGNEEAKQLVLNIVDGYLAHAVRGADGSVDLSAEINFETDERRGSGLGYNAPLFWAAWQWTKDDKYLAPISPSNVNSNAFGLLRLAPKWKSTWPISADPYNSFASHVAWQISGRKELLENYYEKLYLKEKLYEYINTEGYIWTDRLAFNDLELQRSRMGGVLHSRYQFYPGNTVSWRFTDPYAAERVGILVSENTPQAFKVELFSTDDDLGEIVMRGWNVKNGKWDMCIGVDTDGNSEMDQLISRKALDYGRDGEVKFTIPHHENIIVEMRLKGKGVNTAWGRADLAIGADNVKIGKNKIDVQVYNLGYAATLACKINLISDDNQEVVASATVAPIAGVKDYTSAHEVVSLPVPKGVDLGRCSIWIDKEEQIKEIRKTNNHLQLSDVMRKR